MNSKRSMWKLFVGLAGVSLLVTNCTIKTDSDENEGGASNSNAGATNNAGATSSAGAGNTTSGDCSPVGKRVNGCICSGDHSVSYQLCTSDGVYGACVCADTSYGGGSSGGASSYAGAGAGGEPVDAAEAGAGGEAGGLNIDPTDCYSCLTQLCSEEWDACAAENENNPDPDSGNYCLSQGTNAAPGQIEDIMTCITNERAKGLVKRDVVRACGSSIGQSADPQFFVWAPQSMSHATEALMNCMADKPDEVDNQGAWANDPNNFPASGPRPWDDMTCAKLACTSKL